MSLLRDGPGERCKRIAEVSGLASLAFKAYLADTVGSRALAPSMQGCGNAHTVTETKVLRLASSALGARGLCESSRCSDALQRLVRWGHAYTAGLQRAAVETLGLLWLPKSSSRANHLALTLVEQFVD